MNRPLRRCLKTALLLLPLVVLIGAAWAGWRVWRWKHLDPSLPLPELAHCALSVRFPQPAGAAVFYRQAAEMLDALKLSEEERGVLDEWQRNADGSPKEMENGKPPRPTPAEESALLAKLTPLLAPLARAHAEPTCDWGIDPDSFDCPHMQTALAVMKILCLQAKVRLAEGNPAAAAESLLAIQKLACDAYDETLVGLVVSRTFESISLQRMLEMWPHWDAALAQKITQTRAALPPLPTFDKAMGDEWAGTSHRLQLMIRHEAARREKLGWWTAAKEWLTGESDDEKRQFQLDLFGDDDAYWVFENAPPAERVRLWREAPPVMAEWRKLLQPPIDTTQPARTAFLESHKKTVIDTLISSTEGLWKRRTEADFLIEAAQIALRLKAENPDGIPNAPAALRAALAPLRNPVDGEPVAWKETEDSLEATLRPANPNTLNKPANPFVKIRLKP